MINKATCIRNVMAYSVFYFRLIVYHLRDYVISRLLTFSCWIGYSKFCSLRKSCTEETLKSMLLMSTILF